MSRSLRIAVVAACPLPVPRGTPVRILRMAEALAARGHEVHIATYHLGGGPVDPRVRLHRIRDVPGYRKLSPGPALRKLLQLDPLLSGLLRQLLRDQRFDVIHAHHYEGLLVGAAARRGQRLPLVYDAHMLLMSELPYYRLGLPAGVKRSAGRWLDFHLPRLADHVACVTDTIHDRLVGPGRFDPARVSTVANGVEVELFDPARVRAAPRTPGRTVIFTGNLASYQGIDLLLHAFAAVAPRCADVRLAIVSESSFEPYEALARELGVRDRIDLVAAPPFAGLPPLLLAADVAVNPRVNCDGMPVKLLNYMAAGLPVVSFAGSASGVVHDQTGWLAESGSVGAFAAGLLALLQDPERARRIGAAARAYVVRHCSWDHTAEQCEQVYARLPNGRR